MVRKWFIKNLTLAHRCLQDMFQIALQKKNDLRSFQTPIKLANSTDGSIKVQSSRLSPLPPKNSFVFVGFDPF